MRILCPTCGGKGRIPDPQCNGKPMCYYNPITGESCPTVFCQTCSGSGWVETTVSLGESHETERFLRRNS